MSDKIKELEAKKAEYIKKINLKGEMSLDDANMLRNFDYHIYMEKHPLLKKFNNWMYPEADKKSDWKAKLKGMVRRLAVLPVSIGYNLSLKMADNHWEKKNIEKYAPNKENKKKLFKKRFVKAMNETGLASGAYVADAVPADTLQKPTKINKISSQGNDIVANKLAALRKKIARDVDETLGTKLEEKKLAKPLKKLEKIISDKIFGKVKE